MAAHVVRTSLDLRTITVQVEKTGQELLLTSALPCSGLPHDAQVMLHRDPESGAIRITGAGVTCYTREGESK